MTVADCLTEVPAMFNDLAQQFAEQTPRAEGVMESHAGILAADVLANLSLLLQDGDLTPGQLWAALAAERGNAGACNMLANAARAADGQLIANRKTVSHSPPGCVADGPEHAQAKGGDHADNE